MITDDIKSAIAAEIAAVTTSDPLEAVDELTARLNKLRSQCVGEIDRGLWHFSMEKLSRMIAEKAVFV